MNVVVGMKLYDPSKFDWIGRRVGGCYRQQTDSQERHPPTHIFIISYTKTKLSIQLPPQPLNTPIYSIILLIFNYYHYTPTTCISFLIHNLISQYQSKSFFFTTLYLNHLLLQCWTVITYSSHIKREKVGSWELLLLLVVFRRERERQGCCGRDKYHVLS